MARPKLISDADLAATVWRLTMDAGFDAPSFGDVSRATGLAAPTLAQRYGTRLGMLRAGLIFAWDKLDQATLSATQDSNTAQKGLQGLLKTLASAENLPRLLALSQLDDVARKRAQGWRVTVETALAMRFGGTTLRGRELAGRAFALWQSRLAWEDAGGKTFRLGEALKALNP